MAIHLLAQELSAVKDFWSVEKNGAGNGICSPGVIVNSFSLNHSQYLGYYCRKAATLSSLYGRKAGKEG